MTTHRVPEDYPTFQAAYDAARDGDTISLAPGTYEAGEITKPVKIMGRNTLFGKAEAPRLVLDRPVGARVEDQEEL